jgi:UDP-N-acetylglucosamine/UDP-N-acetylgalactosamine diphosphorylase
MIKIDDKNLQAKVDHLHALGQDHIFVFWEKLDSQQRTNLLQQIEQIDVDLLRHLVDLGLNRGKYAHGKQLLEPAEVITLSDRKERDAAARQEGEKRLREGKVAAFLVAGGQGTRLGFPGPKGMYPITPVRNKSLFQLHTEKLLAMNRRYRVTIPWYIMTSQSNHDETVAYFKQNNFFGYPAADVRFFSQEMIPAIDRRGKLMLDAPDHLFMNPNGHGGSIKALWQSGAIADMRKRGIEQIYYFQVDNVLLIICDPVFIGYHIQGLADMSNKVLRKSTPEEKIGVICNIDGRPGVVEYSDLSKEDMYALEKDGGLKYWAGSIAIHMLSVNFVEKENISGFKLPYHIAEKNIPCLDEKGMLIQPPDKNGIKFETFVFDALRDAEKTVSVEVEREQEFSPVKNATGVDSAQSARQSLVDLYAGWLEGAGYGLGRDKETERQSSPLIKGARGLFKKAQGRRPEKAGDLPQAGTKAQRHRDRRPGEDLAKKGTKAQRHKGTEVEDRDRGPKLIEISPLFALDAEELKQKKFQIDPQADEIYLGA